MEKINSQNLRALQYRLSSTIMNNIKKTHQRIYKYIALHCSMRKVYGQSTSSECIFCNTRALLLNAQKFPVCNTHRESLVDTDALRCTCGGYLDIRNGKFGAFFTCMHCGPRSISKIKELNDIMDCNDNKVPRQQPQQQEHSPTTKNTPPRESAPKTYTISTNDVEYF